jgi:hypothetical protein
LAGEGVLFAVFLKRLSPTPQLSGTDAEFFANQSVDNTGFIGSSQGLSF